MSTILSNGLVIGAIYGLVALGITLVYKKSGVLNFAHGEVGMVGAFVFYVCSVEQRLPYLVSAAAGIATSAVLGCATFLLLARRRSDPLNMLIGTLAVAGVLTFVANEIWGPDQHYVPPPLAGVRVDVVTWTVAGALAGAAAVLVAPLVGFDIFFMTLLAIRGFAAALLAGLTNVPGALAAGLTLGLAEAALTRQTTQPGLPEAVLVGLIVLFLLRPQAAVRRTA